MKWVCIRVIFIGCFWMHGPTPYSVKWCLRTGIPTALQCVHALNTASVPRLFFHNVTIKFTNRIHQRKELMGKKIWTLIGPFHILFYPMAMYLAVKKILHNYLHMIYLLLVVYLLFTPVLFNTNMFSKLARKSFDPVQFSTSKRGRKTLEGARIS